MGGSGFLGNALGERLSEKGWNIRLLTRKKKSLGYAYPCTQYEWDGIHIPLSAIEGTSAVINLVGQNIADHAWTVEYKKKLRESRIYSTAALVHAISSLPEKPEVVIQASAIGYYGMGAREEECTESSQPGSDFLSDLCKAWEGEIHKVDPSVRTCIARIGLVLGWEGGALPKLWDIYASSLGGLLGQGSQWMNSIHIEDLVKFFMESLEDETYSGTYNLVSPSNVRQNDFHSFLCEVTPSYQIMKVPDFILKFMLGERSKLVLEAPRISPQRLIEKRFDFLYPTFEESFKSLLEERVHNKAHYFKVKQWLPLDIEKTWDFFSKAENLESITPNWLNFRLLKTSTPEIQENTLIDYQLKLHRIPIFWTSRITQWTPKQSFRDEQEKGPYKLWAHQHLFKELAGGCLVEDRVEFELPLFPLGQLAFPFVKKDVVKIFQYRKRVLATDALYNLSSG